MSYMNCKLATWGQLAAANSSALGPYMRQAGSFGDDRKNSKFLLHGNLQTRAHIEDTWHGMGKKNVSPAGTIDNASVWRHLCRLGHSLDILHDFSLDRQVDELIKFNDYFYPSNFPVQSENKEFIKFYIFI